MSKRHIPHGEKDDIGKGYCENRDSLPYFLNNSPVLPNSPLFLEKSTPSPFFLLLGEGGGRGARGEWGFQKLKPLQINIILKKG